MIRSQVSAFHLTGARAPSSWIPPFLRPISAASSREIGQRGAPAEGAGPHAKVVTGLPTHEHGAPKETSLATVAAPACFRSRWHPRPLFKWRVRSAGGRTWRSPRAFETTGNVLNNRVVQRK